MVDECLGLDEPDFHPVGADIIVRRIDGLEVDLQDLDSCLHRALLQLGIGLQIGIVGEGSKASQGRKE